MKTSARFSLVLTTLALAGCPSPVVPTLDSGVRVDTGVTDAGMMGTDTGTTDAGTVTETDTGTATGTDSGTEEVDGGGVAMDGGVTPDAAVIGMDAGVTTSWTDCREAVVFGVEGEACAFTGSCVECALVASPRQVLCMAGRLRVAPAGPGACASGTDAGVFTFPDAGPRPDAGVGVDGGGVCPPLVIADPAGGVCLQSTVDCIRGGGSPSTCITADPTCLQCAQAEITACATRSGCDDEAGAARCCFDANCPDGSCATTTCARAWNAFVMCSSATDCSVTDLCFPSAPACPPAAWPAPTAVSCTMTTSLCVDRATTGAELQACLDADTTGTPASPAGDVCNSCVNDDLLSCATDASVTANACDDELGLVECCLSAACPSGDGACRNAGVSTGGACATDWSNFVTCANATITSGACGLTTACFP